jgi:hypothetical protein
MDITQTCTELYRPRDSNKTYGLTPDDRFMERRDVEIRSADGALRLGPRLRSDDLFLQGYPHRLIRTNEHPHGECTKKRIKETHLVEDFTQIE